MDQISTNNSFKCEEFDTLLNSQQGLEEHENMLHTEGKAVVGNNIYCLQ
jgi:hypothetical protein